MPDGSVEGLEQRPADWPTADREERWEELDRAARTAAEKYRERSDDYIGIGRVCSPHAPAPNSINADITPDEWHFSSPAENVSDPQLLATLLNQELSMPITIQERTSEWEDGYWFVVEGVDVER